MNCVWDYMGELVPGR